MFPRMGIAILLAAGIAPAPWCQAKPADLPGTVMQQCPTGRHFEQCEGFSCRPDATEALPPSEAPAIVRAVSRRPVRETGDFEEQDALPVRVNHRGPTERRDTDGANERRWRDEVRQSSDDERRLDMLRSTEPLDTLRQRVNHRGRNLCNAFGVIGESLTRTQGALRDPGLLDVTPSA